MTVETTKAHIINYILANETLNKFLDRIVIDSNDDFRQHFYLKILEAMEHPEKLTLFTKLYNSKNSIELGKYCTGIINTLRQSNSSYQYKRKINGKAVTIEPITDYDFFTEEEYKEPDFRKIVANVLEELNHIRPEEQILFKLFYGIDTITNEITQPKTYKQIHELTGVNYYAVRDSVRRTKAILLQKIKL